MKAFKIFAGVVALLFVAFAGYAVYLITGYETEKNKARTKNATLARWPKNENGTVEEELSELEKLENENEQ